MKQAFADYPELNQQVVVYEFSDPEADHGAAENPTIAVSFNLIFYYYKGDTNELTADLRKGGKWKDASLPAGDNREAAGRA
ncbi:MAG: hypothetical protein GX764_02895 [Firmicutes bacterium]|nr:hypothetical protein [Bacillota bacterium]